MKKKFLIIMTIFATIIIVTIFFSFSFNSRPTIIRLVTSNSLVEGDLNVVQIGAGDKEIRRWLPDRVEIKVGVPVTLVLVNDDDVETHQFDIPELNVTSNPILPFESTSIEFIPNSTGTFTFIDSRPKENYTFMDYRGIMIKAFVDHSTESGKIIVRN